MIFFSKQICVAVLIFCISFFNIEICRANDLADIKKSGIIRHLGVPYANFIIAQVKSLFRGASLLGVAGTCLDPALYNAKEEGAMVQLFSGNLNRIAPAIINAEADTALLDVPDALIALEKWPGKVKIIGPVSVPRKWVLHSQKTAPMLRAEFNRFLSMARKDGTLIKLVKKYYPSVFDFYPDFFK